MQFIEKTDSMATEVFSGPVEYLVFAFDREADIGSGLQALVDRVDQGLIEILDLELVTRDSTGLPVRSQFSDLPGVTGFDVDLLIGAESGTLDADDLATIVEELEEGQFAVAVVYEDRSLAAAAEAWTQAGGFEVFSGGVAIADLEAALEEERSL